MTSNFHSFTAEAVHTRVLEFFNADDNATRENNLTKGILEALVDRFTLPVVLSALADVCEDKAAHIRENWQDGPLAREWDAMALKCNKTALSID